MLKLFSRRGFRRLVVACLIAVGHVLVMQLTMWNSVQVRPDREPSIPMTADILESRAASFLWLNADLTPVEIAVRLAMPDLTLESEDNDRSVLPPMIDPEMRLDVSPYSARAGLPAGVVATVILLLEIGSDGVVLSAEVVRSNAASAANDAAVDYAKATQWSPGRVDGEPKPMQASLTVILGERA